MKKLLPIILALCLLFTLSCRNQPNLTNYSHVLDATTEFSDWSTLFDVFWSKMNTNYVFWDLDDPSGTEWEGVYTKYKPLFDKLGPIYESEGTNAGYFDPTAADSQNALWYFFNIVKDLHDGHYSFGLKLKKNPAEKETTEEPDSDGNYYYKYSFSTNQYRNLKGLYDIVGGSGNLNSPLNPSETTLFNAITGLKTDAETGNLSANFLAFMSESPGVWIPWILSKGNTAKDLSGNTLYTVQTIEYEGQTYTNPVMNIPTETSNTFTADGMTYFSYRISAESAFTGAVGELEEGIVYFGFNAFAVSYLILNGETGVDDMIKNFWELATADTTKGIIIDMRGNGGGVMEDLSRLWGVFLNGEDLTIGKYRRKGGDNGSNYGPWAPFVITSEVVTPEIKPAEFAKDWTKTFDNDVPIVVLTNRNTGSCGEITTLIFKTLEEKRGFNVEVIGEKTAGATGMGNSDSEQRYNAGTVTNLGQIATISSPYMEFRDINGVSYEGIGIEPDQEVKLTNYSDFTAQVAHNDFSVDLKLQKALDWLRTQQQ